jgi:hypothetical protein
MMKLPIDARGIQFTCTHKPELRTVPETGQPRLDRETRRELFQTQVMALTAEGAEILAITVPGEPAVSVGQPVIVEGLVALPWAQGDRAGIAYRAAAIRPASPAKQAGNVG